MPNTYLPVPTMKPVEGSNRTGTISSRRRQWEPGFLRRLPWTGLLSIFLALGCAIAAVAIALDCDGKPLNHLDVDGYVVQPAVLLSILATLANALLVYAFTEGATIHWWTMAFKGATLGQLHSSYHY